MSSNEAPTTRAPRVPHVPHMPRKRRSRVMDAHMHMLAWIGPSKCARGERASFAGRDHQMFQMSPFSNLHTSAASCCPVLGPKVMTPTPEPWWSTPALTNP